MEPQSDFDYTDFDNYPRDLEYSQSQPEERQYGSANAYFEHPDFRRVKENGPLPFTRNYSDPLPMPNRKQAPPAMPPPPNNVKRTESTFVMDISPSVVGWIIGRSGIRIKEIQAQTGCKMWVDQDVPNDQPRKIYFHGNKSNIDAAVNRVSGLVQTAPILTSASAVSGKGLTSTIVDCPVSLVGLLIGKRGWTIKKIQQASGAQISINQSVREGLPRKIIVSGDESAVSKALHLIDEVLRDKSLLSEPDNGHYPSPGPSRYDYDYDYVPPPPSSSPRGGRPDSPLYDPRIHGGINASGRYSSPMGSPLASGSVRSGRAQSISSLDSSHYDGNLHQSQQHQTAPSVSHRGQQHYSQGAYGSFSDSGYGDGGRYSEGAGGGSTDPYQYSPTRQVPPQLQQLSSYFPSQASMPQYAMDGGGDDYGMSRSQASSDRGGPEDLSPNSAGGMGGGGGMEQAPFGSPSMSGHGHLTHMARSQGGVHAHQSRPEYQPPAPRDMSPYRGSPAQHSNVLNVAASDYPVRRVAASPIEHPMSHSRGTAKLGYVPDNGEAPLPGYMGSPRHHRMGGLTEPRLASSPVQNSSDMFTGGSRAHPVSSAYNLMGDNHAVRAQQPAPYGSPGGGGHLPFSNGPSGGFDPAALYVSSTNVDYAGTFSNHSGDAATRGMDASPASRVESSRFEASFFRDGDAFVSTDEVCPPDSHDIHQSERDIDSLLQSASNDMDPFVGPAGLEGDLGKN